MATHSSVLAWRIPGTGKPGGLPSRGSHRVGHDWSGLAAAAANDKCLGFGFSQIARATLTSLTPGTLTPSIYILVRTHTGGFPGGAVVKNLPTNPGGTRDMGPIPGSGRAPGVGNGNPLQYFWLENSIDRGAWQAIVHEVKKSWTQWSRHTHSTYSGGGNHAFSNEHGGSESRTRSERSEDKTGRPQSLKSESSRIDACLPHLGEFKKNPYPLWTLIS